MGRPVLITVPAPRVLSAGVFVVFGGLWLAGRWPAFIDPFWIADDFSMWDVPFDRMVEGAAGQGRWLNAPWYALYRLFAPTELWASVLLRVVSGLLHTLAAWLVGRSLVRLSGSPWLWLAPLPFLLWGFNAEATLWFAASTYPLAAVLTIGGVSLLLAESAPLKRSRVSLAVVLLALGVNSNQAGATAGLVFGLVWLLVGSLRPKPLAGPLLLRRGLWIGVGYALGAAGSVLGMVLHGYGRAGRFNTGSGAWEQWSHLQARLWSFPEAYVTADRLLLVVLAVGAIAVVGWSCGLRRRWRWAGLVGLGVVGLLVVPLLPCLLAADNTLSTRLLYAGTFVWVGLAALVLAIGTARWMRALAVLWMVGWVLTQHRLAWREAASYGEVFRQDLATLRALEAYADTVGCHEVLFMDWAHSGPWRVNPHGIAPYYEGCIKRPVFHEIHWGHRFLRYYSPTLENTPRWEPGREWQEPSLWTARRSALRAHAASLPREEWIVFDYLSAEDLILVVPR